MHVNFLKENGQERNQWTWVTISNKLPKLKQRRDKFEREEGQHQSLIVDAKSSRKSEGKNWKFSKIKTQKVLKPDKYKQDKHNPLLNSDSYQKEHSSIVRIIQFSQL